MTGLVAPGLAFAAASLAVAAAKARRPPIPGAVPRDRPRPRMGVLERVGRLPPRPRQAMVERILRARDAAGADGTVPATVGAMRAAALASVMTLVILGGPIVLAPAVAFAASRVPVFALARRARRRRLEADRELPVFLDLVSAAVSAGLTGHLAVRRAADATTGALAAELGAALRRVDLGGRWREELESAAGRLELPDLRRAVVVLTRSEAIGASLAEALGDLARESREARRIALAERARKAPVKMLFPLVFLVLPAFLLLTVVPVLVATLRSIG